MKVLVTGISGFAGSTPEVPLERTLADVLDDWRARSSS
jgi:hypothetical protein